MRAPVRVVLTRSEEDNATLMGALGTLATQVVNYPCITIERLRLSPENHRATPCSCVRECVFRKSERR